MTEGSKNRARGALTIDGSTFGPTAGPGVSNSGFISAYSSSNNAIGIHVQSAIFQGGITNTGTLAASSDQNLVFGIFMSGGGGTFNGGVSNGGTILGLSSSIHSGIAIAIENQTLLGGISNTGLIIAYNNAVAGDTAALALQGAPNAQTITQTAGQIIGGIIMSGHGDTPMHTPTPSPRPPAPRR